MKIVLKTRKLRNITGLEWKEGIPKADLEKYIYAVFNDSWVDESKITLNKVLEMKGYCEGWENDHSPTEVYKGCTLYLTKLANRLRDENKNNQIQAEKE